MKKSSKKVEVSAVEVAPVVAETVEIVEVIEVEEVNFCEGLTLEGFMDSEYASELGYKKAVAYWKLNGAKAKVTGFRAKFYAALVGASLSDSETLDFAKANGGSENDIKQISHFYAIAKLTRDIRADLAKVETAENG